MSEMAEAFNAMKEASQEKRARNRENSARILREKGIKYDSYNAGAHLIVDSESELIDFWPGTGKFIARVSGKKGRGVFNLLKLCQ